MTRVVLERGALVGGGQVSDACGVLDDEPTSNAGKLEPYLTR